MVFPALTGVLPRPALICLRLCRRWVPIRPDLVLCRIQLGRGLVALPVPWVVIRPWLRGTLKLAVPLGRVRPVGLLVVVVAEYTILMLVILLVASEVAEKANLETEEQDQMELQTVEAAAAAFTVSSIFVTVTPLRSGATSSSFVKRPLPPISESALSRIMSPCVFMMHCERGALVTDNAITRQKRKQLRTSWIAPSDESSSKLSISSCRVM